MDKWEALLGELAVQNPFALMDPEWGGQSDDVERSHVVDALWRWEAVLKRAKHAYVVVAWQPGGAADADAAASGTALVDSTSVVVEHPPDPSVSAVHANLLALYEASEPAVKVPVIVVDPAVRRSEFFTYLINVETPWATAA